MTGRVFVTGATGFAGKHVVRRLAERRDCEIVCLVRPGSPPPPEWVRTPSTRVRLVRGDLTDPASYEQAIRSCRCVLHMAAVTGRAARDEYHRVNVDGTRSLADAARSNGRPHFLHVSTIAVHFDGLEDYPYAASKACAESVVAASGLDVTIVRPTLVLGREATAWRAFAALAKGPIALVPGDGAVSLQPIHVADLARVLTHLTTASEHPGGTHDIGGPEVVTIDELLTRIRRVVGRAEGRRVHLPLAPLKTAIAWLERILPVPPPVAAGQLSTFEREGTVREGSLQARFSDSLMGVDEMIECCLGAPLPNEIALADD